MKNKALSAVIFVFAALLGTAVLVGSTSKAFADDYGYSDYGGDYGYSDYGGDYGYADYGYGDYGYAGDYGYSDYGYAGDYGYGDYGYGYDSSCDYGCGQNYGYSDYGYSNPCDYGCGSDYGYQTNPCDYGCGGSYDCNDCNVPYDDCFYGYCNQHPYVPPVRPTPPPPAQPVQPIINNTNNNNNNNANVNNNVNNNNIRINISNPTNDTPVRRDVVRDVVRERDVIARADDQLVCTPVSQSAGVNQTVNLNVSGGNGTYSWFTPEAYNVNRRGTGLSLAYATAGFKNVTVTSGNQTASCSVQVTGGQVLAANIELPDTGMGGLNAQMGNIIAFIVSLILGAFAVVYTTRRRRVIA